LVAKNAILVVDFTNNLKGKGYTAKDALIEATKIRCVFLRFRTLSPVLTGHRVLLKADTLS
jgi:HAE1 family hydrophobic/amphiphilic exporter-1